VEKNKPKYIFKYHRLNDYLYESLRLGSLWFSHQLVLNDPFDCKYSLSENFLDRILQEATSSVYNDLKKANPDIGITEAHLLDMKKYLSKNQEWMNNLHNMLFMDMGWSICCFSTDSQNDLMWSHYADNHKGACLIFDTEEMSEPFQKLSAVLYDDKFPIIESMDDLSTALLSKRKAWQYEKEWRVITNISGYLPFNKKALVGIHFGCNTDKESINNIRSILADNGYNQVSFKQNNLYINGIKFNQQPPSIL
jgi:hypothetical protein